MIDLTSLFHFHFLPVDGGARLSSPTALRIRALWEVPHRLPWFEGHFPGRPVLPAVAILDATLELIRQRASHPEPDSLAITEVRSAKFLRPVSPGQRIEIEAEAHGPGEWRASWREAGASGREGASSPSVAELAFRVDPH